jgi:hypothetical protein
LINRLVIYQLLQNMTRRLATERVSTMPSLVKRTLFDEDPTPAIMQDKKEPPAVQKPFTKTYRIYGDAGRRDAIIALLKQQHRGEPFLQPFMDHLLKIDVFKLDPYKKMEFDLSQFGIKFTFLTSFEGEDEMSYPISDLSHDPDWRLKRARTWSEWLTDKKI